MSANSDHQLVPKEMTCSVLSLERSNKPPKHPLCTLKLILALRDTRKRRRVLAPVSGEFSKRGGRENDFWGVSGYCRYKLDDTYKGEQSSS